MSIKDETVELLLKMNENLNNLNAPIPTIIEVFNDELEDNLEDIILGLKTPEEILLHYYKDNKNQLIELLIEYFMGEVDSLNSSDLILLKTDEDFTEISKFISNKYELNELYETFESENPSIQVAYNSDDYFVYSN